MDLTLSPYRMAHEHADGQTQALSKAAHGEAAHSPGTITFVLLDRRARHRGEKAEVRSLVSRLTASESRFPALFENAPATGGSAQEGC